MADAEVATKAPESDAVNVAEETASIPTQEHEGLSDHCVTDRPAPVGAAPSGEITKLADVDVYISKPGDYPHQPGKLLLFLTGGTGVHSTNNQLQADKFAAEGFVVVMPDMFDGDAAPNSTTSVEEENATVIEQIKMGAVTAVKSFQIDMWLARHTSEKVMPILLKVIEAVNNEFADAVAGGGGIYGVGYCIGAKYILILGAEKSESQTTIWGQKPLDEESGVSKSGPHIKVGAVAHGTLVTREDFDGIKSPIFLVCVENDQLFPAEILTGGVQYLEQQKIEHGVKTFSGVPHGFAIIGEYSEPDTKAAQSQAFQEMLGFLKAH